MPNVFSHYCSKYYNSWCKHHSIIIAKLDIANNIKKVIINMIAFMHTVSKFHFAWPSKKRNLIAVKTSFDDLYIIIKM